MEILYILLVLLLVTRTFGELAVRLGQSALVGELISGIVLGTVVARLCGAFPVLSTLSDNEVFLAVTDLGVFFLMLHRGVEMRPQGLAQSSGRSLVIATCDLRPADPAGRRLRAGLGWAGLGWAGPSCRRTTTCWPSACSSARRWPSPPCPWRSGC